MRLERFLPLLKNEMYFPRPIQFNDRWEGMFPPSYMRQIQACNQKNPDLDIAVDYLRARCNKHRHAHFVSCWHMSEHESDAMWRLYALAPEGLAIKSTVGSLLTCFGPHGHGPVQYYDPSVNQRTDKISSEPKDIQWKRQDFAWEKEYRIWFNDDEMIDEFSNAGDLHIVPSLEGKMFRFSDTKMLIKQIVVAPFASPDYVEILKAVLSQSKRSWMIPLIKRSSSERSWEEFASDEN